MQNINVGNHSYSENNAGLYEDKKQEEKQELLQMKDSIEHMVCCIFKCADVMGVCRRLYKEVQRRNAEHESFVRGDRSEQGLEKMHSGAHSKSNLALIGAMQASALAEYWNIQQRDGLRERVRPSCIMYG